MSTQKTKEELIRLAWIAALRRSGDRQCEGELFNGTNVCAMGLLAEVTGMRRTAAAVVGRWGFNWLGRWAGLSPDQTTTVWHANDDSHTFSEIADVIEGWFK